MSFERLHKWVSYGLSGLGLFALSIGPELELPAELLIFAAWIASWFAEGARIRDPRWTRGWTIGVVVFLLVQSARGFFGAPLLPLVLELTAALQISRLFNRRGAREHQQIAALALLHLIAATVLSTEITYALVFLGFVVVVPWTLALGHLRAELEAQHAPLPEPEREEAIARTLRSPLVGTGFLLGTAALAVPLFAMTAGIFLAFPRVGLGFLTLGRDLGQRVSGFGADVELGDFGLIRTDPTVVLRVEPPSLPADPPERMSLRLRGTSFDHYDGRRWTRSSELESESVGHADDFYPVPHRFPQPTQDRAWSIVLDALDEPVIFLPPDTVGLEIPPRMTGGVPVGRDVHIAPGVDVRYGDADGMGLRYVAWTAVEVRAEDPDPDLLRRYLQVPEGHERVAELARAWTAGAESDGDRVERIVQRLRESGEYTYSLETPPLGGRLPLEVFLFEAKRGHCEYYSTSLAVMLRTLGVPTRNVTGFLGGRYNAYGSYYAISQGDAHSWVEVWLPARGWVVLDPTPSGRDAFGPGGGWLATLRQIFDAIETRWADDVVGYDLRSQISIVRQLRDLFGDGEADAPARSSESGARSARPDGWLLAGAGLLVIALAVFLLLRRRRAKAAQDPERARVAIRLYRALDRVLAKLGHPRPPSRTPDEQLAALEAAGFTEMELVREVTDRHRDARYGGGSLDAADGERLERRIRALVGRRDLFPRVD